MQSLLLFKPDDQPFAVADIERIFHAVMGFRDVRFNRSGCAIEAVYTNLKTGPSCG